MKELVLTFFIVLGINNYCWGEAKSSPHFSVNWLDEVVGRESTINLHVLTSELDKKIGSAENRMLFLKDWLDAIDRLIQENTRLYQVIASGGWNSLVDLGYRKFDLGGGTTELVIITRDPKLRSLLDTGMAKALEYSMLQLGEKEWSQFKSLLTIAIQKNQSELKKLRSVQPYANVNYLAFTMATLINDLAILQRLPSHQRDAGAIEKLQLRKMDLLEMTMTGDYLSNGQKSMILNNVAFAFESAAVGGEVKTAVGQLLAFSPLLNRLQNLGKFLPSGSIENKHGYEYFKVFVGSPSVIAQSCIEVVSPPKLKK